MANSKISALPLASTPLTGTEVMPVVQGGITEQVSVADLTAGRSIAATGLAVDANSATAAVRITQLGVGNALLVEDSTNPDATPFVVDANGFVAAGSPTTYVTGLAAQGRIAAINNVANTGQGLQVIKYRASPSLGADIELSKSASTTIGTNTLVGATDVVGTIWFTAADGTTFIPAATIVASLDGTPGTNDMPGRLVFSTTADGSATPTERMRIDSTGQTKFSYNAIVEVNDSTNAALRITQLGTGNALLVEDSSNPDATPFVVDANGKTVVGNTAAITTTESVTAQLQVHATNAAGAQSINIWGAAVPQLQINRAGSGGIGTYTALSSGNSIGKVTFGAADGTAFVRAAEILAAVDGTPGTNDMPGRLIFSTTADGASTPTERMRIDSVGNTYVETGTLWQYAPAPTAKAAAATLTAAELQTGILSTTGTTYTITLPTGTAIDAGFTSVPTTGIGFDWYVVNTASGIVTIAVGASGMTSLGALTIATGVSAHFRFRRTAANTYVLYRLS